MRNKEKEDILPVNKQKKKKKAGKKEERIKTKINKIATKWSPRVARGRFESAEECAENEDAVSLMCSVTDCMHVRNDNEDVISLRLSSARRVHSVELNSGGRLSVEDSARL